MADRYHVEGSLADDRVVVSGAEAHHLAHVMRAKPGTEVTLFDGQGLEARARVERVGRAEIELSVLERASIDRELPIRVTLGVALPKGDRQRTLVEKAVELGIARLVPLVTIRSTERSGAQLDRLRRTVIEAAKQCGRNRLMEIAEPTALDAFLATAPKESKKLFAHLQQSPSAETFSVFDAMRQAQDIWLAVGPEGGFTADEVELAAAHGWQIVHLGSRILRIETAAIALAAAAMLAHE